MAVDGMGSAASLQVNCAGRRRSFLIVSVAAYIYEKLGMSRDITFMISDASLSPQYGYYLDIYLSISDI